MSAPGLRTARAMLEADVASRLLGIELLALSASHARTTMTVTASMLNGHFITHATAAVAARADIRFLRPTKAGDILIADAVERARYGRNGIYDVTVTAGDRVIAEFRGDSRTIPAPQ